MNVASSVIKPAVDIFGIMLKLDLTYKEAELLKSMWDGGEDGMDAALIMRSTRQHIYAMRPRLLKHHIFIVNLADGRYALPQDSRNKLNTMFL